MGRTSDCVDCAVDCVDSSGDVDGIKSRARKRMQNIGWRYNDYGDGDCISDEMMSCGLR